MVYVENVVKNTKLQGDHQLRKKVFALFVLNIFCIGQAVDHVNIAL